MAILNQRRCPARGTTLALIVCLAAPALSAPLPQEPQQKVVRVQRLAHYVDWFVKCPGGGACDAWQFASTIPFRRDDLRGVGYNSLNAGVIRDQNREMWTNGIVPLISWWGPDGTLGGDGFFRLYLSQWDPNYPVRPGILYEALGRLKVVNGTIDFADPDNANRFIADMHYLDDQLWSRYPDRFYLLRGRPLIFIWISQIFRGPFAQVLAQAQREVRVSVIGSEFNIPTYLRPDLEKTIPGMDAISSYGIYSPRQALKHAGHVDEGYVQDYATAIRAWSAWLAQHSPNAALVPPLQFAFDDRLVPGRDNPQLTSTPEEAQRLADTARFLIQDSLSNCGNLAPLVLVVSYNEHFEGSAIEPNDRYGTTFLDIMRDTFAEPMTRALQCP